LNTLPAYIGDLEQALRELDEVVKL
jgi:hypothetical protein